MKVLVASSSGVRRLGANGHRAIAGELVYLFRNEERCAECGCRWATVGMASGGSAPSFAVVDRPDLDAVEYRHLMAESWLRRGRPIRSDRQDAFVSWCEGHLELAAGLGVGAKLSFLGGRLHQTETCTPAVQKPVPKKAQSG